MASRRAFKVAAVLVPAGAFVALLAIPTFEGSRPPQPGELSPHLRGCPPGRKRDLAAFAFGWSPCIGATMGAVLTIAAGRGSTGGPPKARSSSRSTRSVSGIPFILSGIGVSRLTGAVAWLRRSMRAVNLVSGLLLVGVGLLFVTNQLFELSIWMQRGFTDLGLDFWNEF